MHRPLNFRPRKPCTSATHLILADRDSPTLHVFDWSGEEVGEFSAEQIGVLKSDVFYKGSNVFDDHISLLMQDSKGKWKVVTFQVKHVLHIELSSYMLCSQHFCCKTTF